MQRRNNKRNTSAKWLLEAVEQAQEIITTTDVYYLLTSHLDPPLALTDNSGNIVWQIISFLNTEYDND